MPREPIRQIDDHAWNESGLHGSSRSPLEFTCCAFSWAPWRPDSFPGMIVYLTYWFPQAYRARFGAGFLLAQPISFIIGSPISGLILGWTACSRFTAGSGCFCWRVCRRSVFAVLVLLVLPDSPAKASWLSASESRRSRRGCRPRTATSTPMSGEDCSIRACSRLAWLISGFFRPYGLTLWLPQIVQAMGFRISPQA